MRLTIDSREPGPWLRQLTFPFVRWVLKCGTSSGPRRRWKVI